MPRRQIPRNSIAAPEGYPRSQTAFHPLPLREVFSAVAAEQATLGPFIEELREPDIGGYVINLGAGLSWFAAVVAAAVALKRRAPRPALVLMALGTLIFAVGHPKPTGPIGISLFLAGVIWLELRPQTEAARRWVSVQPT
jgi:hypothetical protein